MGHSHSVESPKGGGKPGSVGDSLSGNITEKPLQLDERMETLELAERAFTPSEMHLIASLFGLQDLWELDSGITGREPDQLARQIKEYGHQPELLDGLSLLRLQNLLQRLPWDHPLYLRRFITSSSCRKELKLLNKEVRKEVLHRVKLAKTSQASRHRSDLRPFPSRDPKSKQEVAHGSEPSADNGEFLHTS